MLTADRQSAHQLVYHIEQEGWGEEVQVIDSENEVQRALGGGEEGQAIVSVWWD